MARIIYVEDDDLAGERVQEILTEAGHLVGVIANGALACDTIIFKRPDLAILDCALPSMSGIDILRRIRAQSKTYLMPILMLTGSRTEQTHDDAMFAGANDFLVKPFEPDELVRRVAAVLRNNDLRRVL
ncbi:hypothetical protein BH10PSE14_BH10PSE14_37370 [soil metagenome]